MNHCSLIVTCPSDYGLNSLKRQKNMMSYNAVQSLRHLSPGIHASSSVVQCDMAGGAVVVRAVAATRLRAGRQYGVSGVYDGLAAHGIRPGTICVINHCEREGYPLGENVETDYKRTVTMTN